MFDRVLNSPLQFIPKSWKSVITKSVLTKFTDYISNHRSFSVLNVFLTFLWNSHENISVGVKKNTCLRVSFLIKLQVCDMDLYQKRDSHTGLQLYQKKTPTQVFFCKFCRILKNIFFKQPLVATIWLKFLIN